MDLITHNTAEYSLHNFKCIWRGSFKKQNKVISTKRFRRCHKVSRSFSSSTAHGRSLILLQTLVTHRVLLWRVCFLAPLRMLKCHWGRHWITTGSRDAFIQERTTNVIRVIIIQMDLICQASSSLVAFGMSPVDSNVLWQIICQSQS